MREDGCADLQGALVSVVESLVPGLFSRTKVERLREMVSGESCASKKVMGSMLAAVAEHLGKWVKPDELAQKFIKTNTKRW